MNTMTNTRSVLATAVLGALSMSLATVCTAAESTQPPQITVKFSDLNVSTPQGAAALYGRIERAAREVCRPLEERNFRSKAYDSCLHQAIADAVAKVGQPALFDAYNAHNAQTRLIVLADTQSR
jgi:UrcA family protein